MNTQDTTKVLVDKGSGKNVVYKPTDSELSLLSYWDFIEYIGFKGGHQGFGTIHREMAEFISKPQIELITPAYAGKKPQPPISPVLPKYSARRLELVPRGHLKSTLGSVGYVLWRIYRNPNIRIAVATATKELAQSFIREVKQYLEDEELQERFWNNRPHVSGRLIPVLDKVASRRRDRLKWDDEFNESQDKKIIWRADAIQVMRPQTMREPTVIATSPGSNITGMHFDLVIMDDVVNDDTVATPEKIDKTLDWCQDLESVIDPPRVVLMGQIAARLFWEVVGDEALILGTRYARYDYYGHILDNLDLLEYSTFIRNVYVNGYSAENGFIWPEKFNEEVLAKIRKRQGHKRFASQYLNKIIADEDIILKPDNITWIDVTQYDLKDNLIEWKEYNEVGVLVPKSVRPILVVDPAISEKVKADYSVLSVGGLDAERNLYIFDTLYGHFNPNALVEYIYMMVKKWKLKGCTVETVSFQQSLVYMLKTQFNRHYPIVINEYRPKGEKKGRITTFLEPIFSNHKIYVNREMSKMQEIRDEISYFPQASVRDDIIDTWAMIAEICNPTAVRKKGTRDNVVQFTNKKYGGLRG